MRSLLGGPHCKFCRHYEIELGVEKCEAYPDGIPDRILIEDPVLKVPAAHWEPYGDEQRPVVFEKRDDVSEEEVMEWDDKRIEMRDVQAPDFTAGDPNEPEITQF